MKKEVYIKSLKDLEKFTYKLSKCLTGKEIITLKGNLGAGKTTFTKLLVKSLGGDENSVTSPTFTIMNEYDTPEFNIYHIDLYRVDSFDLTDFVGNGLIIIEWPKENYTVYSVPVINIEISVKENEERVLKISVDDDKLAFCINS